MKAIGWACVVAMVVSGCGKSSSKPSPGAGTGPAAGTGSAAGTAAVVAPDPAAATRFAPVKPPAVSAACAKARYRFGYVATCEEQPLPELETAAGKVLRLWATDDPTKDWLYALVPPSGDPIVAEAGPFHDQILRAITDRLDVKATAPEVLARIYATVELQAAVVRCGPGDTLPAGARQSNKPCAPPAFATVGGKQVLQFTVEEFPHPHLMNRTKHRIYWYQVEVLDHELSSMEGRGVLELEPGAPLPPSAPPLPTMTAAPTWPGAPVAAPDDVSAALCAKATDLFGWIGRTCKAYGYPSLELPTGALYVLANDAGERHVAAVRKPDGTIALAREGGFESPLTPLVASYDAAKVPPQTFLAAYLFLDHKPARVLCVPGSGDQLPDLPCTAPSAERRGDALVVKAILHELPLARGGDPAVREIEWEFTPGGGMTGGGTRLIDLRAP